MFVIGICGGTGSGKTTIIRLIEHRVGPDVFALLPHDMYYRNPEDIPSALREAGNFDHPDVLDNELYIDHVTRLRAGRAIERPVYRYDIHRRTEQTLRVEPRAVLILDGILLLALPKLLPLIDLKVFVDAPDDLRILRRIQRDQDAERARSVESIIRQYVATVRPMHEQYVKPSRRLADIVVPWENYSEAAVELLSARVRAECGLSSRDVR